MAAVVFDNAEKGAGGSAPIFAGSGRPLRVVTGQFDFDSSYVTGGEDITSIFDKFASCLGVIFEGKGGYVFETDYANKKVKAMRFDYPAAAAGVAVEVPNATNLSTVVDVRFIAYGYMGVGQKS